MRGYLMAVALATAVVMISAADHEIRPIPTSCPAEDSKDYTVHLRHEDCTKFYKCQWGNKIEMECPLMNKKGDRLHFNPLLQVCDYPNRANCKGSTPVVGPSTDPTPGVWNSCDNAPDGAQIPHETRCYLFYKCVNHKPVLQECPEKTVFDADRRVCDRPIVSRCLVTDVCKDYRDTVGVYIPDPNSCKHAYYCKDIQTIHYVCPVNAEWSVSSAKCMAKNQAGCVRRYDY